MNKKAKKEKLKQILKQDCFCALRFRDVVSKWTRSKRSGRWCRYDRTDEGMLKLEAHVSWIRTELLEEKTAVIYDCSECKHKMTCLFDHEAELRFKKAKD